MSQCDEKAPVTVAEWFASAPSAVKYWLRSVVVSNFIAECRRAAFTAPGMYDGAMSEECKLLYRRECEMLSQLQAAIKEKPMVVLNITFNGERMEAPSGQSGARLRAYLAVPDDMNLWRQTRAYRGDDVCVDREETVYVQEGDTFYTVPKAINGS